MCRFLCLYHSLVCVSCDKPSWPGVTEEGDECECCVLPSSERNVRAPVSYVLGNDMFIKV